MFNYDSLQSTFSRIYYINNRLILIKQLRKKYLIFIFNYVLKSGPSDHDRTTENAWLRECGKLPTAVNHSPFMFMFLLKLWFCYVQDMFKLCPSIIFNLFTSLLCLRNDKKMLKLCSIGAKKFVRVKICCFYLYRLKSKFVIFRDEKFIAFCPQVLTQLVKYWNC